MQYYYTKNINKDLYETVVKNKLRESNDCVKAYSKKKARADEANQIMTLVN